MLQIIFKIRVMNLKWIKKVWHFNGYTININNLYINHVADLVYFSLFCWLVSVLAESFWMHNKSMDDSKTRDNFIRRVNLFWIFSKYFVKIFKFLKLTLKIGGIILCLLQVRPTFFVSHKPIFFVWIF